MRSKIAAVMDGEPCDAGCVELIKHKLAALEAIVGPMSGCRVTLQTEHGHPPSRVAITAFLELRRSDLDTLPCVRATLGSTSAALDAVFAAAATLAGPVPAARQVDLQPAHVVQVSPARDAGVVETDSGERLKFRVADGNEAAAMCLHVGGRAWIRESETDHAPLELLCIDGRKTVRVQLAP